MGKNFVFRILIEIIFVLWVFLVVRNRKYLPGRSAVLWSVLAFFVVISLSTAFSINPYKSLWSNAERMEGLFGLLHVLALFVVGAGVFKGRDWIQFMWVVLLASVGVAVHGLGQLAGWYDIHQGGVRVDASFGNAAYFAGYTLFIIFFSLFLITRIRRGEYVPLADKYGKWVQWALVVLSVVYIVLLFFNATRGAMVGLAGGLGVVVLLATIFGKGKTRKRAGVVLLVLVIVPVIFFAVKDTPAVQNNYTLGRFADISLDDATTQSRFLIWGMSIEAWKERPILGYGMENFTTVFAEHYRPQLWSVEPWYDRAHNVPLDWLVSAGILGLVAYLSLFIGALVLLVRLFRQNVLSVVQAALFAGLLAAYFIHNIFVFDNVISYLLFFALLAYLHSLYKGEHLPEDRPFIAGTMARNAVVALVALVMLFSLYAYNIKPIKAAGALIGALKPLAVPQLGTENIKNAQTAFEKTIAYGTFLTTEAREQLVTRAAEDVSGAQLANAQVRSNYLAYAEAQGEAQIKRYPHDMRALTFLASLYVQTGKNDKAEELALELVERAPTRPLFYLILGEAYLRQEKFDEALEAFKTANELAPDYPEGQVGLAMGLIESGKLSQARAFLERQYGTASPPIPRIIQAYMNIGAFDEAILGAQNLVKKEPDDIRWHFNLSKLYVVRFRDAEAIAELEKVIELEPRLEREMQTLINQIQNGTINRGL